VLIKGIGFIRNLVLEILMKSTAVVLPRDLRG
jgi:hypothetical protein